MLIRCTKISYLGGHPRSVVDFHRVGPGLPPHLRISQIQIFHITCSLPPLEDLALISSRRTCWDNISITERTVPTLGPCTPSSKDLFLHPQGFKRRTLLSQEVGEGNGIIKSIDKLQLLMCGHYHCVSGSNLVPALSLTRYHSSCSAVSSEIHRGHKPLHRQSIHLKC